VACASEMRSYMGVKSLISLLYSHDTTVQANAAGALFNCAAIEENASEIRACNGIKLLVSLLSSESAEVQLNVLGCLFNCSLLGTVLSNKFYHF